MLYELRVQYVTPPECEPGGRWHIVELGQSLALCGHTVDTAAAGRPLADWGGIDSIGCCDPCQQIHHVAAGRPMSEDWHVGKYG